MKLGVEVGLVLGHIVLNRDLAPPPAALTKKGHISAYFSAYVYCGQTVAYLSYC